MGITPDRPAGPASDTIQYGGQQNTQTEDRTAEQGGEERSMPTALAWAAAVGAGSAFGFNTGPLGLLAVTQAVNSLTLTDVVGDGPEQGR